MTDNEYRHRVYLKIKVLWVIVAKDKYRFYQFIGRIVNGLRMES